MEEFLIKNVSNIIFVVVAVIVLIILFKRGATKQMKDILFHLVLRAEQEYGTGTGEMKYAAVVSGLYEKVPSLASWLFTKRQINNMIEMAVVQMKEYLNTNPIAQKDMKSKQKQKVTELELLMSIVESLKPLEKAEEKPAEKQVDALRTDAEILD